MKAPRRWTSLEELLRAEAEAERDAEPSTRYRSVEGGRVEPRPGGHAETRVGEWRDGERVAPPERREG